MMAESQCFSQPPIRQQGVSRDLVLWDDAEDVDSLAKPVSSIMFDIMASDCYYNQSTASTGQWNIAALIDYFKNDSSQFESELLEGVETNGAGPAIGAYNDVDTVSSDATTSRLSSWPFVTPEDDYDETTWFLPNNTTVAAVNTDSNNNYRKWNLPALTDYCKKSSGAVVVSPVRKKSTLAPIKAHKVFGSSTTGASGLQAEDRRAVRFCEVVEVCPVPKRVEPAYNRIDVNAAQRAVLAFRLRIPDEGNRQTLPSSVPSTPFASDTENARDASEKVLKKSSAKEQETRHAERPETSRHADGKHKSNKRMRVSSDSDSDGGQPAKKSKRASVTPDRDNLEKSPEVVDSPRRMKAMLDKYCSVRFSSSSKTNPSSKHSQSPKFKKHSAAPFSGHHKKILFGKAPSPPRFGASALSESARKHKMEQNERERRRQQQIVSGQWTEQRSRAHERSAQLKKFAEAARRKQAEEDAARREFVRKQYEMVENDNSRYGRRDVDQYVCQSLQRVTPLVEKDDVMLTPPPEQRLHTSVKRIYHANKPTIEPFLPIQRVYIDGEDSEATATHRLFKNLTVKAFKVARQAHLVESENEQRMFPERQNGDKTCRFRNRIRCAQFDTGNARQSQEPVRDGRRLREWKSRSRSVSRFYDQQIDEAQCIGQDAECFLKNVMSMLLHVPNSPFGDTSLSKNDMLRGLQQSYAKKTKTTGFERFLALTLPMRAKKHHLHEFVPPPPLPAVAVEAEEMFMLPNDPFVECPPPLPEEEFPPSPPPPPPPPPMDGDNCEPPAYLNKIWPPVELQSSPPLI